MKKPFIYLAAFIAIYSYYHFHYKNVDTNIISKEQNFLIVGTSSDYPPYSQIDLQTGQIVGLEIDLITEIAERLNKKIILKDMPFNSLVIELMSGQIDIIAAGLSPSQERSKSVLFSNPYIDNDDLIAVNKKSSPEITSITDLYGKNIAVNTGYTSDVFLSNYPEIHLLRLKSTPDTIVALRSDVVDAFVVARSIFNLFLREQSQDHNYQFFALPSSAEAYAFAYEKNNIKLKNQIDDILDVMIKNGTIETIKNKWTSA